MSFEEQSGSRSEVRGLIVDFGGVLTTPLADAMESFAHDVGLELQDLVRAVLKAYAGAEDRLVTDFETGLLAEDDFARQLADRLAEDTGVAIDPAGLVTRMFSGIRLEEAMFAAVEAAREAGIKTCLCSNSWGDSLYPRARLADAFDVVVISGEVGLRKPDPGIFRLAVDRLGLDAGSCVFVDDHPGHLEVAAGEGMRTVLHTSPAETLSQLEALLDIPLKDLSSGN